MPHTSTVSKYFGFILGVCIGLGEEFLVRLRVVVVEGANYGPLLVVDNRKSVASSKDGFKVGVSVKIIVGTTLGYRVGLFVGTAIW